MESLHILLVEDNPGDVFLFEKMLNTSKEWDFEILKAGNLKQALKTIQTHHFDVIIADLGLPDSQGLATVDEIVKNVKYIPVIVLTSTDDEQTGIEALKRGAQDYLIKWKVNPDQLMLSIRYSFHRKKVEEKLIESEEKFRKVIENIHLLGLMLDKDGKIMFANDYLLRLTGWDREEVIGKNWVEVFVPAPLKKRIHRRYREMKNTPGLTEAYEYEILTRKGERLVISWSNMVHFDNSKQAVSITSIGEDITKRKAAEEALQDSEKKFRIMVDASPDAVITMNMNGSVKYASQRTADIFGYKNGSDLVGKKFKDLVDSEYHKRIDSKMQKLLEEGTIHDVFYIMNGKGGSRFYGEVSSSLITDKKGRSEGVISIIKDVTERKDTEKAIRDYQHNLRSMASQLNIAEEKERRKIAVDLHDDLGQTLAMARIKLSAVKSTNRDPEINSHLMEMEGYITQAIKSSRSLTYELSPPVLYEFGLAAAVNWKLEQIATGKKMKTRLEVTHELPELQEDLLILLFRAVSELLNNTVKHARADNVSVLLNMDGKCLNILVSDDGIGFNPEKPYKTAGIGLFSLRERLECFNGTLTVDSDINKGTRVYITIPVID